MPYRHYIIKLRGLQRGADGKCRQRQPLRIIPARQSFAYLAKVCYSCGMKDLEHAAFSLLTPVPRADAASMHPMSLAFVGDAVQSLYMRTAVTVAGGGKTGALHREVTRTVNAVSQAAASARISPLFDETEADIFRRARNCHIQTSAKHAEPAEYRRASGLEAVFGYLYLTGQTERLVRFLDMAAEEEEKQC